MDHFQSENFDLEIAKELLEDINDQYAVSESLLIELDREPEKKELIHALFRAVHTIKGNLGIVGFLPAMVIVTPTEEILSLVRAGTLPCSALLSDLILLILDRIKSFVGEFCRRGFVEYEKDVLDDLGKNLEDIVRSEGAQQQQLIAKTIRLLDPSVAVPREENNPANSRLRADSFLQDHGLELDKDVQFFRDIMEPIESRSKYWNGRGDRILKMALLLNKLGGSPLDTKQLAVAVYVHDFGMAFMPIDLLHKEDRLTENEIVLLRSHAQSSSQLLQHMRRWGPAKEMILQHHEAANGSGYPYGLVEEEICDGAKIIAVADTFDALTHQRAYISHQKRPIIRAAGVINACAGQQLSQYWVNIFNQAVEPVFASRNK